MTDDEMLLYLEEAMGLVAATSADRDVEAHAMIMKMSEAKLTGVVVALATCVASSPEAMGKLMMLVAKKRAQLSGGAS